MHNPFYNQDSIYPFKGTVDSAVSFVSDIRLALKDQSLKSTNIIVRNIVVSDGQVQLTFGSSITPEEQEAMSYLGTVRVGASHWGTIDNQYIFGFVYIANIPHGDINIDTNMFIQPSLITERKDIQTSSKKQLKINKNIYKIPTVLALQYGGALSVDVEGTNIYISRITQPCYQFNTIQSAISPFYITSINNTSVNQLQFSIEEGSGVDINIHKNTIYVRTDSTLFPSCDNTRDY